jgi:hypothetical protein
MIYQQKYFSKVKISDSTNGINYQNGVCGRKVPHIFENNNTFTVKRLLRIARSAKAFNLVKLHVGV